MKIKDLASKVQGNVWITVETSEAMGLYEKNGTLDAVSSAHKLKENTLIEFESQYWDMIKDDVIGLDITGLRFIGLDRGSNHPGIIMYVDMLSSPDEPITEELMVETEAELYDAVRDDSFDRIRLACDIKMLNTLAVYDTAITLDLAGHTLSFDGQNSATIRVGENADLTIIGDGVVHGNACAISIVDGGNVAINDGAYICGTGSDDSSTSVIYVQHGMAFIDGGAFSNSDPTNGILLYALDGSDAVIECRGGEFIGENPVDYVVDGYMVSEKDMDGVCVYTVSK